MRATLPLAQILFLLASPMVSALAAITMRCAVGCAAPVRSVCGRGGCVRATIAGSDVVSVDADWATWASAAGIKAPKVEVRATTAEERGKGGVYASEKIAPMEVVATIPRELVLRADTDALAASERACDPSWATRLTAAALLAVHAPGDDDASAAKQAWISSWVAGGWATDGADLGAEDVRWGPRDVTGSLLATGSDNDANIYAKFRFPCHPVVHRAGLGLAALTGADKSAALGALIARGFAYRSMRDALLELVTTPSTRPTGSAREKRAWDVADMLSRVLSRATALDADGERGRREERGDAHDEACVAVVPLHERLAQCDGRGENVKLVGADPRAAGYDGSVLLVATRAIEAGEPLTRDYACAPRLPNDHSDGALRLLLQFGLPPAAWPRP